VNSDNSHDTHDCVRDIADLLTWCRRLSDAGPGNADPTELAAYQQAKSELLARLTGAAQITHPTDGDGR
jgi:hypothetical protein